MLNEKYLEELKNFANELADRAREIVASYHAKSFTEIEIKPDGSPVTIADKECERQLRAMINKKFPNHGIIGEEFGNENTDAEFVWSLDPIDGTMNFTRQMNLSVVSVALLRDGAPYIGVVCNPYTS